MRAIFLEEELNAFGLTAGPFCPFTPAGLRAALPHGVKAFLVEGSLILCALLPGLWAGRCVCVWRAQGPSQ